MVLCFYFYFWLIFIGVVFLKPDFNCYNSFALSWVDKVTTWTQSFVSVIANVVAWFVVVPDDAIQLRMKMNEIDFTIN